MRHRAAVRPPPQRATPPPRLRGGSQRRRRADPRYVCIEGVGVVDARHPFAAFAEDREPRCGALLPRGRVRREILVRPPCRRRLLERREAERKQTETERQPVRLYETDEVRGVANGRTYVGEVIGIVVRCVPLDDVERERWRVIR